MPSYSTFKNWGISEPSYFDILRQFMSKPQFPSPTLIRITNGTHHEKYLEDITRRHEDMNFIFKW